MAYYQRNPISVYDAFKDAEKGISNDYWFAPIQIGQGTALFPELPPMKIGVKGYKGWVDNSATGDTNTVNGAVNDLGFSYVFTIQPGFLNAKDLSDAAVSSIIKVGWNNA